MRIVAGLSCIDDYERLVRAGADEVFIGYVPYEYTKKYGNLFPINRRKVFYINTQIKSFSDMKILRKMVDKYKVPVSITFNNIYYLEEQYQCIAKIIKELTNIGFGRFIIADIGLILYLKELNINCSIHLSGECSEINRLSMDFFNKINIKRYIFNRKVTIEEMKSCISYNVGNKNLEYEAFILNERCHYTGAFCTSFNCDEMIHLCEMPYKIGKIDELAFDFPFVDEKLEKYYQTNLYMHKERVKQCVGEEYKLGSTGCGLCALKKLQLAGVTHLKIIGRGEVIDNIEKDVLSLKKALKLLNKVNDSDKYESLIKENFFRSGCSKNCYYNK